jgi:hypothetical protein
VTFLRDRQTGLTSRVSSNTRPGQRDHALVPAISRDGRWVAYSRPGSLQVYLYDAATGAMHLVTRATATTGANAVSLAPVLNADGSVVAFASTATNLTAADTNAADDVFVATSNLIYNGTFGAGAEHWQTFAMPAGGIVSEVSGGAMRFYRTGSQAVVLQPTRAAVPQGVPLEARLDLANTSPSRRRVSVLVHDNDFTDLSVCTFWLAPGAPSRTYRMRTHTTRPWTNATLSIYAATVGSDGFYVVDNVSLNETPEYSAARTDCVDPTAPIAPGGPDGNSLLVNGDFSAGLAPWGLFGVITSQISAGVFEFVRPDPYFPAGVVLQSTGQALPAGDILRGAFDLGNSSGVRKRVTVLLHDGDFSDLGACTFWLAPGQPLSSYEMRSFTTEAWSNATLSVYVATLGPDPWIRLDNASLRRSPGTTLFGTECTEPGGAAASARPALAAATSGRSRDVPRNTIGESVRTPIATGGAHYLAEPLDLAGTTRARLTFYSVLAETAAPGQVQTSEDGITWVTVAEVSASASVVPVEVDLSTFSGSRLHIRFVAGQPSGGWWISRIQLWRD